MATVLEKDDNLYEVVKVLNPDGRSLNVSLGAGAAADYPTPVSNDSFGRLRTSAPFTLFDSSHRYADNGLWNSSTATGGTATFNANEGCVDLTVTTSSGSEVLRETKKVFAYQPGKSLLVMTTAVFNTAKTNLRQRVGYFGSANGVFVELDGTTLSVVKRSSVTGSVVDTKVSQANWNIDPLDGTGDSKITLDITKIQIIWFDLEWLGSGNIRFGFVFNGQLVHCHTFQHANLISSTYITTATLPLRYEITNTGATASASTLKQICSTVLSEGGYDLRGNGNSISTPIGTPYSLTTAGTYYPVISIRLLTSPNRLDAVVLPTDISILGLDNTANYSWRLVTGGTTTGGTWVDIGSGSPVAYNRTGASFSGGSIVSTGFLSGSNHGGSPIEFAGNLFVNQLERNTFTTTPTEFTLAVACSNNSGTVLGAVNWNEIIY